MQKCKNATPSLFSQVVGAPSAGEHVRIQGFSVVFVELQGALACTSVTIYAEERAAQSRRVPISSICLYIGRLTFVPASGDESINPRVRVYRILPGKTSMDKSFRPVSRELVVFFTS